MAVGSLFSRERRTTGVLSIIEAGPEITTPTSGSSQQVPSQATSQVQPQAPSQLQPQATAQAPAAVQGSGMSADFHPTYQALQPSTVASTSSGAKSLQPRLHSRPHLSPPSESTPWTQGDTAAPPPAGTPARTVEDRLAALEKSQAALEESVQEIVKILRFITCCCPCI
ncbi:hypothetical protein CHLRE_02g075800v5 [Chlamydomonas reinhardtii]|uniref:Uncharacterized protein n=1 Tax=Chlamydomonas reinhardtii TaxID=3055 RepID=A0A2K3E055_CHLRE|nr:uncharacterized protein CHLRE_02g075800v5 [Chlamydomonas reinhardtii]PNW86174.1 hypothetical protein CHLRE_02g075800v5 [Chlamydomonas reinhardtii]